MTMTLMTMTLMMMMMLLLLMLMALDRLVPRADKKATPLFHPRQCLVRLLHLRRIVIIIIIIVIHSHDDDDDDHLTIDGVQVCLHPV